MTLLILITSYREDLDFILIENVALLNYDLWFWIDEIKTFEITLMIWLSTDDLIRCRDDWDVMLIEDVIFFSYDLDYGWINLILISRIYILLHDWFLTISVMETELLWMISLISVTILHVRSFMIAIDRSDLLMT